MLLSLKKIRSKLTIYFYNITSEHFDIEIVSTHPSSIPVSVKFPRPLSHSPVSALPPSSLSSVSSENISQLASTIDATLFSYSRLFSWS